MIYRCNIFSILLLLSFVNIFGQDTNLAYKFTGIVYDDSFTPLPYTHVIASGTGEGDMTDSLGIFTLYIRENDNLSFYNIAYQDAVVPVNKDNPVFYIKLKQKMYPLKEAKIFSWGSSYSDFLEEVNRQGIPEDLGEELGLPQQAPDAIPFNVDEKKIKSAGFFFSSPVSFLYHNLSKYEKSVRKAYKLDKDKQLIDAYNETLSMENIGLFTGLEGQDLDAFMIYLNSNINCSYHCGEIELYTEISNIWEKYKREL